MTPAPHDYLLHPDELDPGGEIHFSGAGRSLIEEDRIELISVGVDIGSSTSHLMISRIVLERMDTRYVVSDRQVVFESDILLTPYAGDNSIDAEALGRFIAAQYSAAGIAPDVIDTGALILTGVAARRSNARAIGELFAGEAGKFVAVSAGDALETLMAAQGSGAAVLSARGGPVVNVDVGGGTTKIALCEAGVVTARTAVDAGARLIAFDPEGRIVRLEPFGVRYLAEAGLAAGIGDPLSPEDRATVADCMAARIVAALGGRDPGFLRLPAIAAVPDGARVVFSGGVSEYLDRADREYLDRADREYLDRADRDYLDRADREYLDRADREYLDRADRATDDLGPDLARALSLRADALGLDRRPARQRIRATVVGASQYTVQVSGSTIFLDPDEALPLRNLAVIAPVLDLGEAIDARAVADEVTEALTRMDLSCGDRPVAVAIPWTGTASYARLSALAHGIVTGLASVLSRGHPLVLVVDGDIGGLLGMQCRSEETVPGAIVSIDGIALSEFDFIDIGEVLRATGAAPVVVKSLLFPSE